MTAVFIGRKNTIMKKLTIAIAIAAAALVSAGSMSHQNEALKTHSAPSVKQWVMPAPACPPACPLSSSIPN